MRLNNKIALITGATGGMGRASARLFAEEGATVVVAARNHERGRRWSRISSTPEATRTTSSWT